MKYFSPSYWFKLWVLTAPLLNNKIQGINGKSIDNSNIKNWVRKNTTSLDLVNQQLNFASNNQTDFIINNPTTNSKINMNKHRHEKHRNRLKRTLNGKNEIRGSWGKVTCSFTPKTFEGIIADYHYWKDNPAWELGEKFKEDMMQRYNSNDISITSIFPWTWKEIQQVGKTIWDNFSKIEKVYTDSSRKEHIEIVLYEKPFNWFDFESVRIITEDEKYYPNNRLDNLENDFPDWNKDIKINLGKINHNVDNEIKSAIKKKYHNFKLSEVYLLDKSNYSHFIGYFEKK
ncbi:hypothetical protein [Spiroplasma endosymbiont of Lasioglossum malachurum]|uniref:hypothetical protein n=1 Tax=Spiroplasma endosymbiont of Lasioglossum malachurum TaxID=3066319 RepID=UPI0030CC0181